MSKLFPTDVVAQTQAVLEAWKKIDGTSQFGSLTPQVMAADLDRARALQVELDAMDAQLVDLRNKRDEVHAELWDKIKRVRNSVKGIYGDDSSEYEMVGGTRRSERKSPIRRPAAVANGQ